MKLDQRLCDEIRSHMGDTETELSEAAQGPLWEQIADSKFRQMMALAPKGEVLPAIRSDLQQLESCSRKDHHRREIGNLMWLHPQQAFCNKGRHCPQHHTHRPLAEEPWESP